MKKSLGAEAFAIPAPAWLIGSYDEEGRANVMTAAWGGLCASVPPCVTVSIRKERASYQNILRRKAFTVNIPSTAQVVQADYAGLVSGKNVDKFSEAGLTPVKGEWVDAPYVQEFPLILECRLLQTPEVGSHTLFIGEIVDVKAEESVLDEQGKSLVAQVNPLMYAPPDRSYYELGNPVGKAYSSGIPLRKG